jgi:hypothetical protein
MKGVSMKKMLMMALAALAAGGVWADTWTDPETGIMWTYTVSDGKASVSTGRYGRPAISKTTGSITIPSTLGGYPLTIIGDSAFFNCDGLTSVKIPDSVTIIGSCAFRDCSSLTSVTIPVSVTSIEDYAFCDCSSLKSITIPDSVTSIGQWAFHECISLKSVVFEGAPPVGIIGSYILDYGAITFSHEYSVEWRKMKKLQDQSKLGGFYQPNKPVVEYVSVKIRENDPTILDCVYCIKSGKPIVKVRALAFKDGMRSFANVVRPETFIDGTAANIGDSVAANVEHKLSWQVLADWGIDLAKVSFEVLATEDQLLPLELRTIPANGSNKAMEFSWNAITSDQVFTALLWLYAGKDEGVVLSGGVLKNGATTLASGASLSNLNASSYVFSKMGFSLLSGSNLTYVKTMSRLGLSPSGALQYAYRWIGE